MQNVCLSKHLWTVLVHDMIIAEHQTAQGLLCYAFVLILHFYDRVVCKHSHYTFLLAQRTSRFHS